VKHNADQILQKAKQVIKDLHQEFYDETLISIPCFISKEEAHHYSMFIEDIWSVSIEDYAFDRPAFLTISDETGEPLYLQSSMVSGAEIILGEDQKYAYKPDRVKYVDKSGKKYVHRKNTKGTH
jgi:hypothetical protein